MTVTEAIDTAGGTMGFTLLFCWFIILHDTIVRTTRAYRTRVTTTRRR